MLRGDRERRRGKGRRVREEGTERVGERGEKGKEGEEKWKGKRRVEWERGGGRGRKGERGETEPPRSSKLKGQTTPGQVSLQGSDHCLLSALQGDHVWLEPASPNKIEVAIGGVIKETKPGKVLVEDDEGKVSVGGLSPGPPGPTPPGPWGALPQRLPGTEGSEAQDLYGRTDHGGVPPWRSLCVLLGECFESCILGN